MRKILQPRITIFLLIIFIITLILFWTSYTSFFFQDDWFTLRISNAKGIAGILSFFIPRKDVIYYRPLGMQLPFFIFRNLFGIHALPFHLLTLLTHFLNVLLVFKLIKLLSKNNVTALLVSLFYSTSATHYIPFYWFSTYAFVLGPTAFFAAFIAFILYEKKRQIVYWLVSCVIFLLGLFVNEMVLSLPMILFVYITSIKKELKNCKQLLPFFFISFGYIMFRFMIHPPPINDSYQIGFGKQLLINLEAYLLWSFNLPEEIKGQLIKFYIINPAFIRDFPWYYFIFILTLCINVFLFYIVPLVVLFFKVSHRIVSIVRLGILWFIIGLLPVIFFPKHSFSYYLPISLTGLLFMSVSLYMYTTEVLHNRFKSVMFLCIYILIFNWLAVSATTINFNDKIHWAPRRSRLSEILVADAIGKFPKSTKVIYVNPSSENLLALNNQDAYKVMYDDDAIITRYESGGENKLFSR